MRRATPSSAPDLVRRLDLLERQNRRLRLGLGTLACGLVALVAVAAARPATSEAGTVKARSLVLVDSTGAAAARIEWSGGQLRFEIPPAPGPMHAVRNEEGSDTTGPRLSYAAGAGARLLLASGLWGPNLTLTDGAGRQIIRFGSPMRDAGN